MADKEYINLNECRDYFYNAVLNVLSEDNTNDRANQIIDIFDYLPAADVAPVKYGHWVYTEYAIYGEYDFPRCSECGFEPKEEISPYCPNCGAKMDETEPVTDYSRNYDILCTLSKEEMADELLKAEWCDSSCAYGSDMKAEQCKECMLKWLNSRRKEDKK